MLRACGAACALWRGPVAAPVRGLCAPVRPAKLVSANWGGHWMETQTDPQIFPYRGYVGFLEKKMALEKWPSQISH